MERNPTLTFGELTAGEWVPITDLTINDVRLVCVEGTYNGSVIYPDNVTDPLFVHLGLGQYAIGHFMHATFGAGIGSGYNYYVKVQRKIGGDWTDQFQFGVMRIGDEAENLALKADDSAAVHITGNESINGTKKFILHPEINSYEAPVSTTQYAPKKYVDDSVNAEAVLRAAADLLLLPLSGGRPMSGYLDMGNHAIVNLTAADANDKAVNKLQMDTALALKATDSTVLHKSGAEVKEGLLTLRVIPMFDDLNEPIADPSDLRHLCHKQYVDNAINANIGNPYQESIQNVRVIPNGTLMAGKVYTNITSAINYFSSPGINKQCSVRIINTNNASSIALAHTSLKSYVHIIGEEHIELILGGSGDSVTKTMNFKNLIIYMSQYDITADRTYINFRFFDCIIYAYKNLTFNGCYFKNCIIYQPTGKQVTINSGNEIYNTHFAQDMTDYAGGSLIVNSVFGFSPSYTMPEDPLTP